MLQNVSLNLETSFSNISKSTGQEKNYRDDLGSFFLTSTFRDIAE